MASAGGQAGTRKRGAGASGARAANSVARSDAAQAVNDSLQNLVMGLGDATRDRRLGGSFVREAPRTQSELDALWIGDGLGGRVVETIPRQMTRRGFSLEHNGDPAATDALLARAKALGLLDACRKALCRARAYGGGALVLGVDDGTPDLAQPLDEGRIREVRFIDVADRWRLTPAQYDGDPRSATFGDPVVWTLAPKWQGSSRLVHRSRLVMFDGFDVPDLERQARNGWGGSNLERAYDALRNWRTVADGLATMSTDLSMWVIKIPGLTSLLAQKKEADVRAALLLRDRLRGIVNAHVVDPRDDGGAEAVSRPLSGVGDILSSAKADLAACLDMPLSVLLGSQATGLASANDGDLRAFYDQIQAEQQTVLAPALERVMRLLMLEPRGATRGRELPQWSVTFPALYQPTDREVADVREVMSRVDRAYYDMGVATPAAIARNRFGTAGLSTGFALTDDEQRDLEGADVPEVGGDEPGGAGEDDDGEEAGAA